jgi:hypothetical protein
MMDEKSEFATTSKSETVISPETLPKIKKIIEGLKIALEVFLEADKAFCLEDVVNFTGVVKYDSLKYYKKKSKELGILELEDLVEKIRIEAEKARKKSKVKEITNKVLEALAYFEEKKLPFSLNDFKEYLKGEKFGVAIDIANYPELHQVVKEAIDVNGPKKRPISEKTREVLLVKAKESHEESIQNMINVGRFKTQIKNKLRAENKLNISIRDICKQQDLGFSSSTINREPLVKVLLVNLQGEILQELVLEKLIAAFLEDNTKEKTRFMETCSLVLDKLNEYNRTKREISLKNLGNFEDEPLQTNEILQNLTNIVTHYKVSPDSFKNFLVSYLYQNQDYNNSEEHNLEKYAVDLATEIFRQSRVQMKASEEVVIELINKKEGKNLYQISKISQNIPIAETFKTAQNLQKPLATNVSPNFLHSNNQTRDSTNLESGSEVIAKAITSEDFLLLALSFNEGKYQSVIDKRRTLTQKIALQSGLELEKEEIISNLNSQKNELTNLQKEQNELQKQIPKELQKNDLKLKDIRAQIASLHKIIGSLIQEQNRCEERILDSQKAVKDANSLINFEDAGRRYESSVEKMINPVLMERYSNIAAIIKSPAFSGLDLDGMDYVYFILKPDLFEIQRREAYKNLSLFLSLVTQDNTFLSENNSYNFLKNLSSKQTKNWFGNSNIRDKIVSKTLPAENVVMPNMSKNSFSKQITDQKELNEILASIQNFFDIKGIDIKSKNSAKLANLKNSSNDKSPYLNIITPIYKEGILDIVGTAEIIAKSLGL